MAAKRERGEPIYVTLGEINMFRNESVDFDREEKTENDLVNPITPIQEESEYSEGSEYSEEFEEMDDYEELAQTEETTVSSNSNTTDESSENNKGPAKRLRILGVDLYFTYYLFYVTVIQSCMKAIVSVCVMSMNFNTNLDTTCKGSECPKPVPAETKAAYFLPCLAVFGISTFHFCVGVWLFTKHRMLTLETMKAPMAWFAVIIGLEMVALYVIFTATNVALGVLIACGVIIGTEMISVLIAFCYPYYKPLKRKVTQEIDLAPPDNAV